MVSSYRPAPDRQGTSSRRRILSFSLAIAAHLLVIWALLRLSPAPTPPPDDRPLSTFNLAADRPAARAEPRATAARRAVVRQSAATAATAPPRPARPPVPAPGAKAEWPTMLSESFDLASVSKGSRSGDASGAGDDSGRGDSQAAYGPGAGPSGQRLYNADWQREPTDGEISGYIHRDVPPGSWAEIACRTVEGNQVDNCRVMGESPIGSGFGRSMREAAWQFRVLPPKLGTRRMLGTWVLICIDLRANEDGRRHCRTSTG